jgi:glutamate synthase domain-containing protein 1
MCGIAGFFKKSEENTPFQSGRVILQMLEALACRGPDSAGVAIFGRGTEGRITVRVKLGEKGAVEGLIERIQGAAEAFGAAEFTQAAAYLRFTISSCSNVRRFIDTIESVSPDVEVVSMGRSLEVVKQVGTPANLEKTFKVSGFDGSHGIGHTRLSTESKVDLSHSQPFWAHGFPDLAIVHNGHITNYHQLRRRYEQRGVHFYTENDSEVIAIYLAEQLSSGGTLKTALDSMMRDLDGSYSCLAATESEMGFIKDPFAFKPLLFTETDTFVAVANEEIAIRAALPGNYSVCEAPVKDVRVWRKHDQRN